MVLKKLGTTDLEKRATCQEQVMREILQVNGAEQSDLKKPYRNSKAYG